MSVVAGKVTGRRLCLRPCGQSVSDGQRPPAATQWPPSVFFRTVRDSMAVLHEWYDGPDCPGMRNSTWRTDVSVLKVDGEDDGE